MRVLGAALHLGPVPGGGARERSDVITIWLWTILCGITLAVCGVVVAVGGDLTSHARSQDVGSLGIAIGALAMMFGALAAVWTWALGFA